MSLKGFWGGRARAGSGSLAAGTLVQRLFSTFPCGLPGAGLLLLRAAAAIPLVHAGLLTASSPAPVILEMVTAGAAILLLIGLWTPLAGGLIAVAELGLAVVTSCRSVDIRPFRCAGRRTRDARTRRLFPGCASVRTQAHPDSSTLIPRSCESHSPRKGCGLALRSGCLAEAPSRVVDTSPPASDCARSTDRKGDEQ